MPKSSATGPIDSSKRMIAPRPSDYWVFSSAGSAPRHARPAGSNARTPAFRFCRMENEAAVIFRDLVFGSQDLGG